MSDTIARRPDRRLILLLGALAACGPLSIDMYLPSLPALALAFGTTAAAAQITLTSFMLGFSLGMLVYGPLSDAYGRRPVLLGGVMLYAVASAGCAASYSIDSLVLLRFLQALGAGSASVLARAIARDAHAPHDAARVLSMLAIVTSIGPLLAPLIGGQLLLLGGWRAVFVTLTLFGIGCAITTYLRVPETWPKEKRASSALGRSFAAYGRLLSDPVAWGHMLCGGMAFASMFAYITATPFVYIDYFHVKPQHYGFFFGLNIIGIIGWNVLNTRLVRRVGSLKLISVASFVSVIVGELHDRPDASIPPQRRRRRRGIRRGATRAGRIVEPGHRSFPRRHASRSGHRDRNHGRADVRRPHARAAMARYAGPRLTRH
jgi:DHA1 family bicyclomycin/chloramphenicol resistance-like MFS transporter